MTMQEKIQKTLQSLEKNRMQAYYVDTREEAAAKVAELLHEGDVVSCGGSVTLKPVSYTHLDVYKRQTCMAVFLFGKM